MEGIPGVRSEGNMHQGSKSLGGEAIQTEMVDSDLDISYQDF